VFTEKWWQFIMRVPLEHYSRFSAGEVLSFDKHKYPSDSLEKALSFSQFANTSRNYQHA